MKIDWQELLIALKTNVKIFNQIISSSFNILNEGNKGADGAINDSNLMHLRIFFRRRNSG